MRVFCVLLDFNRFFGDRCYYTNRHPCNGVVKKRTHKNIHEKGMPRFHFSWSRGVYPAKASLIWPAKKGGVLIFPGGGQTRWIGFIAQAILKAGFIMPAH